jgi:hypothetical protein
VAERRYGALNGMKVVCFELVAPGVPGVEPPRPVCWPRSSFEPPAGVPLGRRLMRETVIVAATGFLILIMAAALIVHFVVP